MLLRATLTILSVSVFAQDITVQKISKLKLEKAKYVCPMHPDVMMKKSGKCPKCDAELNLSTKEQMKRDVKKITPVLFIQMLQVPNPQNVHNAKV